MKRVLAFIILISHINFTMFIPQLDEVDCYDASGQQIDDINSLYEYVDQVVLGHKDSTPEDEDDDTARYFHIVKINNYVFFQQIIELDKSNNLFSRKTRYPPYTEPDFNLREEDIQSPPPKAC